MELVAVPSGSSKGLIAMPWPSRRVLYGLLVLFAVLVLLVLLLDLGALAYLIYLVLVALVAYFAWIAIRDFRQGSK